MPRIPIYNFHSVKLSLAQSSIREVISRYSAVPSASALAADHPLMQAAGPVLDRIYTRELIDADSATEAYKANRTAQQIANSGTREIGEDCLDLLAQYVLAWVFDDTDKENEIASEFRDNNCDPGWLTALIDWLAYYWDGQPPQYVPPASNRDPSPIQLPPPASADGLLRVGILGDWGTGEPEAKAVLDQLMQQAPDLIIHVGDIYYAGTEDECRKNFLRLIKKARRKHKAIPVYVMPGNHEYYSGGKGFYTILPKLNQNIANATVQQNSFFCLQNDSWQLEGMDTGYNDHDILTVSDDITHLQTDEAAWHQQQLASAGNRQVILFSHHQLFSAFQTIGAATSLGPSYQNPYLLQNLQTWRADGNPNIVAWFWGHEHLLEVYSVPNPPSVELVTLGRCIGNSAFPVFNNVGDYIPQTQTIPLEPASGFPNDYVQTGDDGLVYASGYMLLTLGANTGTADYYQVNFTGSVSGASSQLLWSEAIPAASQP
jgi:3',5'-cyclic AMP phosphodiesterase CpdA